MKKTLLLVIILSLLFSALFPTTSCDLSIDKKVDETKNDKNAENTKIEAEIIDLEFEPGRFSEFDAVAAILETEDGQEVRLDFDNIDRTMTAIGGGMTIIVSEDGKKLVGDYSEYMVTFTLKNGNEVLFQVGESVYIIMKNKTCYLYDK